MELRFVLQSNAFACDLTVVGITNVVCSTQIWDKALVLSLALAVCPMDGKR